MNSIKLPRIYLAAGRERSARQLHPWIYSGAIDRTEGELSEGAVVEVYAHGGEFVGCGFYSNSSIALKLFSFRKTAVNEQFFLERIRTALELRTRLRVAGQEDLSAYRLINGEGDGLPGMIIDRYGDAFVIQFHHMGPFLLRSQIAAALAHLFTAPDITVYCKSADTLHVPEGMPLPPAAECDAHLLGSAERGEVLEHGIRFGVDWVRGQKTGFFIDQRDNRGLLKSISAGSSVLNAFCYTGGFTLAAASGGATQVVSVDVSAPALEQLKDNISRNSFRFDHQEVAADCFEYLKKCEQSFDVVIIDPPPFAKQRAHVDRALSGYRALQHQALRVLKKGGYLLTFSCSQVVGRDAFRESLAAAASDLGRQLQIVRELGAPGCHPVALAHSEGSYLKGYLARA